MCCDATMIYPLTRAGLYRRAPLTIVAPYSWSPNVASSRLTQNSATAGLSSLFFFFNTPFSPSSVRRGPSAGLRAAWQQSTGRLPGAARAAHARRLARGGSEAESASMSLNGGSSPSTFAVPVSGSDRRLAAKERAAAKYKSADHRRVNAEMAAALEGGGAERALHRTSCLTKVAASALQRPPTSIARTVSLQRLDLHSSG